MESESSLDVAGQQLSSTTEDIPAGQQRNGSRDNPCQNKPGLKTFPEAAIDAFDSGDKQLSTDPTLQMTTADVQRKVPPTRCVNCDRVFTNRTGQITEIQVGYCLENEDEENVSDCSKMFLVDAVYSVFSSGNDREVESVNELRDAGFCLKCAKVASQLYGHFNTLLNFSTATAPITQAIPQFKNWHLKHSKNVVVKVVNGNTETVGDTEPNQHEAPVESTFTADEQNNDEGEVATDQNTSNLNSEQEASEIQNDETEMKAEPVAETSVPTSEIESENPAESDAGADAESKDKKDETEEAKEEESTTSKKAAAATPEEVSEKKTSQTVVVTELRKSARERKKNLRFGDDVEVFGTSITPKAKVQTTKRKLDDSPEVQKKSETKTNTPSTPKSKVAQRKCTPYPSKSNSTSTSREMRRRR